MDKKQQIIGILEDLAQQKGRKVSSYDQSELQSLALSLATLQQPNESIIRTILFGFLFLNRDLISGVVDFGDADYWIKKILETLNPKK